MMRHLFIAVAFFAVAGLVAGIGWGKFSSGTTDEPIHPVGLATKLPSDGPEDWVSFANQVVIAEVLRESEPAPDADVVKNGEGYVSRSVVLRIEETVWEASGAETVSREIEIEDWGWTLKDGKLSAFSNQMKVGGRYLVPLVLYEDGWGSQIANPVPVEGSRVSSEVESASSWVTELSNLSASDLRPMLAATEPHPLAAENRHLSAETRARIVVRARGESGEFFIQ